MIPIQSDSDLMIKFCIRLYHEAKIQHAVLITLTKYAKHILYFVYIRSRLLTRFEKPGEVVTHLPVMENKENKRNVQERLAVFASLNLHKCISTKHVCANG